ncbi:hypothetical protein OTU49_011731 [Cherax quadricarinatus]|uniref:Uncharacterized protein n=2 Tax=Cherax quadricarinatus TaxID=27406 RepID=A0AAW0W236_CHEQU
MTLLRTFTIVVGVVVFIYVFLCLCGVVDEWVRELEEDRTRLLNELEEAFLACDSPPWKLCEIPGMGTPASQVTPAWASQTWPVLGIFLRGYQASQDVKQLEILLKDMNDSCKGTSSLFQFLPVLLVVILMVLGATFCTLAAILRVQKSPTLSSNGNPEVSGDSVCTREQVFTATFETVGPSQPLPHTMTLPNTLILHDTMSLTNTLSQPVQENDSQCGKDLQDRRESREDEKSLKDDDNPSQEDKMVTRDEVPKDESTKFEPDWLRNRRLGRKTSEGRSTPEHKMVTKDEVPKDESTKFEPDWLRNRRLGRKTSEGRSTPEHKMVTKDEVPKDESTKFEPDWLRNLRLGRKTSEGRREPEQCFNSLSEQEEPDRVITSYNSDFCDDHIPKYENYCDNHVPEDDLSDNHVPEDDLGDKHVPEDDLGDKHVPEDDLGDNHVTDNDDQGDWDLVSKKKKKKFHERRHVTNNNASHDNNFLHVDEVELYDDDSFRRHSRSRKGSRRYDEE